MRRAVEPSESDEPDSSDEGGPVLSTVETDAPADMSGDGAVAAGAGAGDVSVDDTGVDADVESGGCQRLKREK